MKVYKLSSVLFFTMLLVACSEMNAQDFFVNNFNIRSGYNHDEIVAKIGTPDSIIVNETAMMEFGHKIYYYYYGNSSIDFNDVSDDDPYVNAISNIGIDDTSLSINSITVGDTISKVKEKFPDYIQEEFRGKKLLSIPIGDGLELSFYYDANNVITRISYVVLT